MVENTPRIGRGIRSTHEVDIQIEVDLDVIGDPKYDFTMDGGNIEAPHAVALFNHFLSQISRHGLQHISGHATSKDGLTHHLYEDTAIALGEAYKMAVGNKKGIRRVSNVGWPFEGNYVEVAVDFSARSHSDFDSEIKDPKLLQMAKHVLLSLSNGGGLDIRSRTYGWDDHHQVEGLGKSLGRAIYDATRRLEGYSAVPSTKGIL